ncbi:MAG: hypothetical protein H6550_16165 [Chitinophagales bacterium]|nr:hypothetical protein [Chitinophagales bacterium]
MDTQVKNYIVTFRSPYGDWRTVDYYDDNQVHSLSYVHRGALLAAINCLVNAPARLYAEQRAIPGIELLN